MIGLSSKLFNQIAYRGTRSSGGKLPILLGLCPLQMAITNKINYSRPLHMTALKLVPDRKTTEFKKSTNLKVSRKTVVTVSVVILGAILIYYSILYTTYTIIEKTVESTDKK